MAEIVYRWWYAVETDLGTEILPDYSQGELRAGITFHPPISASDPKIDIYVRVGLKGTRITSIHRVLAWGVRGLTHRAATEWRIYASEEEARKAAKIIEEIEG